MRDGRMANAQLTNYIIPTTLDTPPISVEIVENPYADGPFGAKGVGECRSTGRRRRSSTRSAPRPAAARRDPGDAGAHHEGDRATTRRASWRYRTGHAHEDQVDRERRQEERRRPADEAAARRAARGARRSPAPRKAAARASAARARCSSTARRSTPASCRRARPKARRRTPSKASPRWRQAGGAAASLQRAFLEHGAAQCGICTPGMLMAALALPRHASLDEIRAGLAGNLCRCTGYMKIYDAVAISRRRASVDRRRRTRGAAAAPPQGRAR